MMTILITGSKGQLGMELRKLLDEKGMNYSQVTDSGEMDIPNKTAVDAFFQKVNPTLVLHCAAYTAVDGWLRTKAKIRMEKWML